eukprot:scpid32595/ scgid0426/ 
MTDMHPPYSIGWVYSGLMLHSKLLCLPGTPDKQRREAHALFDRKAAMADEIDLCKGDYLVITDIHEDGWARGKNFRTKKYGLLPINHVRILPKQPQEEQHVQQRQSSQSSQ